MPPEILSLGVPPSCGDVQSQSISIGSRTGQNIIYLDFSSIYKRIVYSKSKRLEMLDLLKKKGNCTIFAAKIKAWNSWSETSQPICAFVFLLLLRKQFFSLVASKKQFYFRCAVCSSCLNFAYCAMTYVASGEYVIRTNSFKLHASGRFR